MISQRAKKGIEYLFMKSAKANLVLDKGDRCHVLPVPENKLGQLPQKNILIQTISSFFFRLSIIFPIDENASTSAYFGANTNGKAFEDVFAEFLNLFCANINRELSPHFPHLGMSTPDVLSSHCLSFLDEIKPELLCSYAIFINDSVQLGASLCMTTWGTVDFDLDMTAIEQQPEEQLGEIELF